MGNRKQPFGYQMLNGEIVLHPQEADTVRSIFEAYSEGAGFAALAEMLNESSVPYYSGKSWNKNMIARLLEDARYTGEKGFPPIIDREQLDAVDAQRKSRSVPPKVSPAQKTLRCFCGFRPTEELEYQVLWQMNRIIAEPDLLCCPTTEKQSTLSLTLEKELDKLLDEQPVDEIAAKTRIFEIAAARYEELDDNKYETERLRTIFSEMNPLSELDADLLTQTVSSIKVDHRNGVKIILKNGQVIGGDSK